MEPMVISIQNNSGKDIILITYNADISSNFERNPLTIEEIKKKNRISRGDKINRDGFPMNKRQLAKERKMNWRK